MLENFFINVVVVIIVLGAMIFIHELGHFLVAKAFGVRVLIFSLGFGKRLLGFKRGDTDYRLSILPFGGYVKMAGDDPSEVREQDPGDFLGKPRWQRFLVVIAGPAMNLSMAVVLLAGLYRFHYQRQAYHEQPARIGYVEAGSPADERGLHPGDLILRAGNIVRPKWEDVDLLVLTTVDEPIPIEVERNGETLSLSITPRASGPNRIGDAGWYPYVPGVVEQVEPGLPAAAAGVQPGDEIIGLDGERIYFWLYIARALQESGGKPVDVLVRRGDKEMTFPMTPVLSEVRGEKIWRIGVAFQSPIVVRQLPWGEAWSAAVRDNIRNTLATFDVLGKILTGRMSTRSLAGPIGIAQISGQAYRAGIPELLMIVAFISLQLGIFNLLPIPVLDGGVILLLLVESVLRRDLSLQVKERFAQLGIVFLLLLAVFVVYNDLMKTFSPS
jgi:regulator of sigma E protease